MGALPGNIIQAIRKAGARDCVMMLDEIDKMGRGVQGDPSAAMLEVLDPGAERHFPRQLSGRSVRPLARGVHRHRQHARHHSGPARPHGDHHPGRLHRGREASDRPALPGSAPAGGERAKAEQAEISDEALRRIIRDYTREAGVRNLEREIGRALRHAAVRIAEGSAEHVRIDAGDLAAILGPVRFEDEVAMRTSVPGVAQDWRGRRWAATSCLLRPAVRRARAALFSRGSSAMLCVRAHKRR